jgi:hypothetical protein
MHGLPCRVCMSDNHSKAATRATLPGDFCHRDGHSAEVWPSAADATHAKPPSPRPQRPAHIAAPLGSLAGSPPRTPRARCLTCHPNINPGTAPLSASPARRGVTWVPTSASGGCRGTQCNTLTTRRFPAQHPCVRCITSLRQWRASLPPRELRECARDPGQGGHHQTRFASAPDTALSDNVIQASR